jgi:hypothetical protein
MAEDTNWEQGGAESVKIHKKEEGGVFERPTSHGEQKQDPGLKTPAPTYLRHIVGVALERVDLREAIEAPSSRQVDIAADEGDAPLRRPSGARWVGRHAAAYAW